mgnify:CR=1 FL=1
MKTNKQVAQDFADMVNDSTSKNTSDANSLHAVRNYDNTIVELYSYNTCIAAYFRNCKLLVLNKTYYSTTTSGKHQTQFSTIKANVYGCNVSQICTVDNLNMNVTAANLLKAANTSDRYSVEPYGVDDFKVSDSVTGYGVKYYKRRAAAEVYAKQLNEAQQIKAF